MTEEFSPRKRSLVATAAAVAFLVLIGLLLGTSTWIFSSALVSIPSPEPDYVVVARPFSQLFIACFVSVIVLVTAHAAVAKLVWRVGRWPDAMTWRHVAPFCPLLLLAFPLVALGMLATPLAWLAPPWLYFLVDLRWWLWVGIIGLLAKSVADAASVGHRSARRTCIRRPSPALVWDLTLIIVLLAGALAVSPTERYSSDVVGDEPKYLRYLENWYRGAGTDITNLVPINDLPTDFKPDIFGNFGHAARGLATIATDLADDVRRLAGRAAPEPPGPARSDGGLFVDGKRGGVYQVHSPGLPALLFPGYVIDRTLLLRPTASPRSQFSPRLFVTSTWLLAIYLLWGWGLFRLLTAYTSNVSLSWVLTCVAMLSLPATAFSYQYYPEAAGGLFLVLVVRYVLCSTETGIWPAFGYGLLAGYLPWIHLRFGVAALVAAIAVTVTRSKHSRRSIVGFWTGLACPLALLSLYTYHITGSLLPSRLMTLVPGLPLFNSSSVGRRLVGLFFDTDWGLVAHAPVYLVALAGLVPMWRHSRRAAILIPLFILSLAVPAAGHGWTGSGTTPLRLVAAVAVLLTAPLSDALSHYRRSRWFMGLFVVLSIVSVQNGFAFNAHFDRTIARLIGPTFSGWISRMALPNVELHPLTSPLLWGWIAVAASLVLGPLRRVRVEGASGGPSWVVVIATILIALGVTSSVVCAWTGVPRRTRFMIEEADARAELLRFQLDHRGTRAWSASRGPTRLEHFFPNPRHIELRVQMPQRAAAGEEITVTLELAGADGAQAWGTGLVDFGDGRGPTQTGVLGVASIRQTYRRPGDYHVNVGVMIPGAGALSRRERIEVAAR